ncbi:16S rRNA (guanine(966)-N(2))-methyltransferase RsmD [Altererythrobacter sp.]|uniref:16S rRNA (guanine(966)-N(2))-methyltransferase RsmD n=1 Tax=Altererythrobacter sp. TaxID=1872480 RepID=UPI001AFEA40F|nr:16S rRNA (guanine(966)-N(2))-methyltransferase RsmD [Altererythrobacter sp.]MBO6608085.1 16S rRNA (guanine(966)-N(2))-methyltransferase RsmD [Altererythrobacter sp.]MBO6641659.1 16S rRNA (guanine(966)-N(2))-methyltransferase RsmD [Altererythrobacter sp.]MBO6707642.1 16S rRNA (guanine(966)-N(2))-methyltransferase RsmD [Altererythrobacter sp.]MBO6946226.1 16S rRNA (guanine(966)-N(2))-methyltransferase RsmD [Altererythrobacter sp.]
MRIVAGEWRGRKLIAPRGDATRPTADRTRETLFNMLVSRVGDFEGLRVADLFAGSGALGLEALSRGAAYCLFVEQEKPAVDAIKANVVALDARDRSDVQHASVMSLGPAREPIDMIFLDPPYRTGAANVALDRMQRLGWIGDVTWVAVETSDKESVDVDGLDIVADRKVGKARLTLLTKAR